MFQTAVRNHLCSGSYLNLSSLVAVCCQCLCFFCRKWTFHLSHMIHVRTCTKNWNQVEPFGSSCTTRNSSLIFLSLMQLLAVNRWCKHANEKSTARSYWSALCSASHDHVCKTKANAYNQINEKYSNLSKYASTLR